MKDYAVLFRAMGAAPQMAAALAQSAPSRFAAAGVTSDLRLAHWLGQNAHESMGFARLVENLTYSSPQRLMAVWQTRFRTVAAATPFVRNPQALANKVYGGRMGNVDPGDGWKYRGRGIKMITGRNNYAQMAELMRLPLVDSPELLEQPANALASSLAFWVRNGCNEIADRDDIVALTRRINGGLVGLDDRRQRTARAKALLG